MEYRSTRDAGLHLTAAQAIAQGLSRDGGLFLPASIPALPEGAVEKMTGMTYPQRAAYIMGMYLDDFSAQELADRLLDRAKSVVETDAADDMTVIVLKLYARR